MVGRCCVKSCQKILRKKHNIISHGFPKHDTTLQKVWLQVLNIDESEIKPYTRICSDHFTDADYKETPFKKYLKCDAVPSISKKPNNICTAAYKPFTFKIRRKIRTLHDLLENLSELDRHNFKQQNIQNKLKLKQISKLDKFLCRKLQYLNKKLKIWYTATRNLHGKHFEQLQELHRHLLFNYRLILERHKDSYSNKTN